MPVTYEHLKPKEKPDLLSDEVPWRAMIAPGVVLQKQDYALQRSYFVRGPDLLNESDEVQGAVMLQANEVFKRLGGEWMAQSEAQRTRMLGLPPIDWADPIPYLIDQRRRQDMIEERQSRETDYYLTLTWTPPKPLLRRGLRYFMRGPGHPAQRAGDEETVVTARTFVRHADFLMDLLRGILAVGVPLTSAKTATYLHNCVSDRWYDLGDLDDWNNLDHQLCDTPLDPAGWYPQLGDWHLRTMSVQGYPAESMVGIMRKLDALNLDYRWCTRWLGMEKVAQQHFLKKAEAKWINQEKSAFDRGMENFTGHQTRVVDPDATNKALDVNAARQEIGMDLTAYGMFTSTVTVWDTDPLRVETKLTAVMQAFANAGFTIRAEDEHLVAAWLSSHPGNRVDNVRRTPQSALTLAHLMPGLNAAWPGPERDEVLDDEAWFWCQTEGNNLLRVVNHLKKVGHFLVLGPTGAGKSTWSNFLRAMWLQRRGRQAMLFDLDKHGRLLTYLLGGAWYDLGSPMLRLQPLRDIDDPHRFSLRLAWLLQLCVEAGVKNELLAQRYLNSGLQRLAQRPADARTFSGLLRVFAEPPPGQQSAFNRSRMKVDGQGVAHLDTTLSELDQVQMQVRWVLERFATGGEHHGILDGVGEDFEHNPIQTFEMGDLKHQKTLAPALMRYCTTHVDLQMSTEHPMLLLLDDAAINWVLPEQQETVEPQRARLQNKVQEWEMTSRKKLVSVGFITHSLSQVFNSAMGPLLLESCPTRFLLPNRDALTEDGGKIYRRMGLTDNAIKSIALGHLQREVFYYARGFGHRMIELPLGPFELDCLARNEAEDHALIDTLLAQEGREGFTAAYLRHRGWKEDADVVDTWSHQQEAPRSAPAESESDGLYGHGLQVSTHGVGG